MLEGLLHQAVWLTALTCGTGHTLTYLCLTRLSPPKRQDWSNLLFSSLFQVVFVSSLLIAYWDLRTGGPSVEPSVHARAVLLYQVLLGYFCYDLCFLTLTSGTKFLSFIAHHIAAMLMILMFIAYGFSGLWFNILFAALGEAANPFLSLRKVLRGAFGEVSLVYRANQTILVVLYFIARVAGFPLILLAHYPETHELPLYKWVPPFVITGLVWVVSVEWFRSICKEWVRAVWMGQVRAAGEGEGEGKPASIAEAKEKQLDVDKVKGQ